MLTLRARLQAEDHDFWRMVAEAWGLHLPRLQVDDLAAALLDVDRVEAVWRQLPGEAQAALAALHRHGGTMPWAVFVRRYGSLRELAPAERRAAQPHRQPQSPTEWLWYRALVGRAFLETPQGLVEHAYIPTDLALLLPLSGDAGEDAPWGRPATAAQAAHPRPAQPRHTLQVWTRALAWVRGGRPWRAVPLPPGWQVAASWLRALLQALGLVDPAGRVRSAAVGDWLTAPCVEAWAQVYRAWRDAPQVNDLRALPHLRFEGPWENDPVQARQRLLAWLDPLPVGRWWDLEAFVAAVRQFEPHFQRPAPEDFHSWYIRRADDEDGPYLQGPEHWDAVDGALVRFWLHGPLHWLGLVDLATATPAGPPTAFRLTPAGRALLDTAAPPADACPPGQARPRWLGRGRLQVPWDVPRAVHYHIARLAEPGPADAQGLAYRLTAASLRAARSQGLRGNRVSRWLAAQVDAWPPEATQAVARVFHGGRPARLQALWVLRLPEPQALAVLQRSPARKFLVEVLTPTLVAVAPQGRAAVLDALWAAGYLAEGDVEDERSE